jgi:hypothetical protein
MDPSLGTVKDGTAKASESTTNGGWEIFRLREKRNGRRILGSGRRICIVLEMRHLLGTPVEKATPLLLK